jgi:hypothetical protein
MQIIAKRVNATARQDKNFSFVGEVLPSFTSKLIITKTKVQITSIWKALASLTFGSLGSRRITSDYGTPPSLGLFPELFTREAQASKTPRIPPMN